MPESKKHHFIPQCYLSNFSIDGKGIWVYNKKRGKPYLTSIDKIFQGKNWYRIPDELIPEQEKDKINPLSIERNFFADEIESQYNDYLKSIISEINQRLSNDSTLQNYDHRLDEIYVDEFAMQIAIQYFRTPEARQEVMNNLADLSKMSQMINPKYINKELISELNKLHNPIIAHFWTIFANDKFIPGITNILKNKIWLTLVSPNTPFYTSDSPVIIDNPPNTPRDFFGCLNERGVIITFPLTSKILFKLLDRDYYADMEDTDRKILLVNENIVKQENKMQFIVARNEIVSPINNFNMYT